MSQPPILVAALYQFTRLDDPEAIRAPLFALCEEHGVKGTLLLAREGINGTIAGTDQAIEAVLDHIRKLPGCSAITAKYSRSAAMPFLRLKVRVKAEIVTLGVPGVDPVQDAGTYVDPQDWNALIADPDVIVIDTRNDCEVAIGQFDRAIDPQTASFRDFPEWFRARRDEFGTAPKVAMYCTGGIRCEKSTAFLKAEGVEQVYHLKGGILSYLEHIPAEESLWRGECFVFDERVSVGHGLRQGALALCRACRNPISEDDRASDLFADGISCPACFHERTPEQRSRYAERQRQATLARRAGRGHIGVTLKR